MRVRLVAGCSGLLVMTLVACSASGGGGGAPVDTEVAPTVPAPTPDAGSPTTDAAPKTDAAPPPVKNDCKLGDVVGVADVAPTFLTYASPSVVPTTMAGGTLQGEYK